jgi:hypothetical protein
VDTDSRRATHRDPVWRDRADFLIASFFDLTEPAGDMEQLWARRIGDRRFEVCCIPFFTYGIALADIVEVDDELTVTRVVEKSDHFTLRAWLGESHFPGRVVADEVQALGASIEWSSEHLLAVDAVGVEQRTSVFEALAARHDAGQLIVESGD